MEFSKKLMLFACFVIAVVLAVAILDWHKTGEGLDDIVDFGKWVVATLGVYMVKSCVENYAKIEQSHLDIKNGKA